MEPESDCLVVVQAIRSNISMRSRFGQDIETCCKDIDDLNKFYLYFIKLSVNMVAHQLARTSYKFPDCIFDRGHLPIELRDCIMSELVVE